MIRSLFVLFIIVFSSNTFSINIEDELITQPLYAENWRLKFGSNEDVDTAAEDIWTVGGNCEWPTSAAETTIVSDDVNDTAAGTGCQQVTVQCLDDLYESFNQIITLNGTTPVVMANDCKRAFRAKCSRAGSASNNLGTIDIKHSSTIISQIIPEYGQTLIACDTIPKGQFGRLAGWGCTVTKATTGVIQFSIDVRPIGGAWQTKETAELRTSAVGAFNRKFPGWQRFKPKTDIRIRSRSASSNNMGASCNFDLLLIDEL